METEQISQNLVSSLNSLRQSGQGMTVSQMMSSGISFADIISMMINGTNQNAEMTGIFDPQLLQNTQQTASEISFRNSLRIYSVFCHQKF